MRSLKPAAIVAVVFGLLTVFSGARALFADVNMGAVVPFVLWFNFVAGFAYVFAGLGLLRNRRWAVWLATAIMTATLLVAFAFVIHMLQGLPYEPRTVGAMALRSAIWVWITFTARRLSGTTR